jgi:hypothetical protein
MERFFKGFTV